MHILNFAHPLTPRQLEQITTLVGSAPERVQDIRSQFDPELPFNQQIIRLLDDLDVSAQQWQSGVWLIVLPSLNYAAARAPAPQGRERGRGAVLPSPSAEGTVGRGTGGEG